MDFKDLKRIIDLIKANDLVEFEIQDGEFRLSTKLRGTEVVYAAAPVMQAAPALAPASAPASTAPAAPKAGIKSPMVGTFYRAANPDSEPFAKAGDIVTPETTVCIIEAMKVMNEIKADTKGRILRCLIENGEAVEFGQILFEIEPL
jgi:acetyl-CoA carboxylase biotin carboxyl carrier protein